MSKAKLHVIKPTAKLDKLLALEHGLYEKFDRQNEDERLYADLTDICIEIIREIAKVNGEKALIIYDYAKLLQQEIQLYSGKEAYIMGCEAKTAPVDALLKNYQQKIASKKHALSNHLQACSGEIAMLLGDCRGLLVEFTEVYQLVHGVIKNNIAEFIHLGQESA